MTIDAAMVMAAGLGKRMRPLTETRPKPLVEAAGRPLIDYALERLVQAGVKRAVVNVHYLADQIEAHLETRTRPEIVISDERGELMDTGGGLVKAAPHLGQNPILCTNTDAILADGEAGDALARLAAAWDDDAMDALLLLCPKDAASGYDGDGDFLCGDDGGRLRRRPQRGDAPYVFTGWQILHPRLWADAPEGPFSTNLLWNKADAAGRLHGLIHDGFWMHVGSPDGLKEAERRLDALKHTPSGRSANRGAA
ncbi:MAG: nucleotidyltransferase family protein [Pseudomonadota bacterium]